MVSFRVSRRAATIPLTLTSTYNLLSSASYAIYIKIMITVTTPRQSITSIKEDVTELLLHTNNLIPPNLILIDTNTTMLNFYYICTYTGPPHPNTLTGLKTGFISKMLKVYFFFFSFLNLRMS